MGKLAMGFSLTLLAAAACPGAALADPPELASWLQNTSGITGYGSIAANVQMVRDSSGYVYVNATGVPAYTIGPWPGNPNIPSNQNYLFKIPRSPVVNAGTKTATPLGTIAVWSNGVSVFNALDAHSYNNQNIWYQNAVVVEASSFDACLGHPAPGGRYHHHQNPRCLYAASPLRHSPVVGYAYDGFPIYGPYANRNADGTGGLARMRSSYRLRNMTQRTTLPDGTMLPMSQYGPPVSATYPLGYYVEDYEYVQDLGDLATYNGRFTVTPEYPSGIYAYFVTIDAGGASAYPYTIGPSYYGVVAQENISSGGHVTISEPVTTYAAPAGAGSIPGSLTLTRSSPTTLTLSWNPSCSAGAQDYGIYQGTIGSWASHTALDCHDDSYDFNETVTPGSGDRYYLLIALRTGDEGSYGTDSSGAERPRGVSTCRTTQLLGPCP